MDNQVNETEDKAAQVNQAINEQKEVPTPNNGEQEEETTDSQEGVQDDVIEGKPMGDYFVYELPNGDALCSFESKLHQSEIDAKVAQAQEDDKHFQELFAAPTQEEAMALVQMLASILTPPVLNHKQQVLVGFLKTVEEGMLAVAGLLAKYSFEPQQGKKNDEADHIVRNTYLELSEALDILNQSYTRFINRRNSAIEQQVTINKIMKKLSL